MKMRKNVNEEKKSRRTARFVCESVRNVVTVQMTKNVNNAKVSLFNTIRRVSRTNQSIGR